MSLRVAVIGVGYLGRHHARIYAGMDGVELSGVVDASEEARQDIASQYGTRAFADYREILPEVDAVSIVTPTVTHFDIAMQCLAEGKDIMLEKPVTATVDEADRLIEEAARLGRIVQVGHLERYNPAVVAMEGLVKSPVLIEAERLSPFLGRGIDVDITLDLMIHDIDIVTSLLGGVEISELRASGAFLMTENIDAVKAWLEFENGTSAVITSSRVADDKKRLLRVYQGNEYLELDYQNMKIVRHFPSEGQMAVQEIDIPQKEPLKEELEDFVSCIRERRRPKVSALEGRNALKVALEVSDKVRKTGR